MTKPAKYITYSIVAVGAICFLANLVFFYWLVGNRPTTPDLTAGYTEVINNHGSVHYVTAVEDRILNLLEIPAIVAVAVIVVVGWKSKRKQSAG